MQRVELASEVSPASMRVLCHVSCACALCRWTMQCVRAARKHAGGQVQSPPGGAGVGRGGGMVLRTRGTPIYILIYILSFISQIPVTYIDRVINVDKNKD